MTQEREFVRSKRSDEILDFEAAARVSSLSRMRNHSCSSSDSDDDQQSQGNSDPQDFLRKTRELIKKENDFAKGKCISKYLDSSVPRASGQNSTIPIHA